MSKVIVNFGLEDTVWIKDWKKRSGSRHDLVGKLTIKSMDSLLAIRLWVTSVAIAFNGVLVSQLGLAIRD